MLTGSSRWRRALGAGSASRKNDGDLRQVQAMLSLLHSRDGSADGARIAARPAPALDLGEKKADDPIVFIRLFNVDRMPRVRHHREGCRGNALLHKDARQKARPVFIAGDDKRRHGDALHFFDQLVKRWSLLLNALLGVSRSDCGMAGEHRFEFGVAARILVFILNAGRAISVAFGECRHALAPNDAGDHVGFGSEGVTLVEFCAITAAADAQWPG